MNTIRTGQSLDGGYAVKSFDFTPAGPLVTLAREGDVPTVVHVDELAVKAKVLNTSGAQPGDLSAAGSPDEDPRLNKNVPYRPKALVFVRSLGRVGRVESVLKSKSDQFVYRVALLDANGASKGEEALAPHADLEPRRSKALKREVKAAKTRGGDLIAKLDMLVQFLDAPGGDDVARKRQAQTVINQLKFLVAGLPKYMRALSNLEAQLRRGDYGLALLNIDALRPAFGQIKAAQKPSPAQVLRQARAELIDYHQRHRGDLGPGWPNQLARTIAQVRQVASQLESGDPYRQVLLSLPRQLREIDSPGVISYAAALMGQYAHGLMRQGKSHSVHRYRSKQGAPLLPSNALGALAQIADRQWRRSRRVNSGDYARENPIYNRGRNLPPLPTPAWARAQLQEKMFRLNRYTGRQQMQGVQNAVFTVANHAGSILGAYDAFGQPVTGAVGPQDIAQIAYGLVRGGSETYHVRSKANPSATLLRLSNQAMQQSERPDPTIVRGLMNSSKQQARMLSGHVTMSRYLHEAAQSFATALRFLDSEMERQAKSEVRNGYQALNEAYELSVMSFGKSHRKALKSRPLQAAAQIRALADSAQRGADLKADQFAAVRDLLVKARSKADPTTEQGVAGKRAIARALRLLDEAEKLVRTGGPLSGDRKTKCLNALAQAAHLATLAHGRMRVRSLSKGETKMKTSIKVKAPQEAQGAIRRAVSMLVSAKQHAQEERRRGVYYVVTRPIAREGMDLEIFLDNIVGKYGVDPTIYAPGWEQTVGQAIDLVRRYIKTDSPGTVSAPYLSDAINGAQQAIGLLQQLY